MISANALDAARRYSAAARAAVAARVGTPAKAARLETEQRAAHAMAWGATLVEALAALDQWAHSAKARNRYGEPERLVHCIGFGETLAALGAAIAIGPGETARPSDLGLESEAAALLAHPDVAALVREGTGAQARAALAAHLSAGAQPLADLGDETLDSIRAQFHRFTTERILPHAQRWHLDDALVPDALIAELADLGAFGLTLPQAHGGMGLGKVEMCIVTEELSRGWIGVGSLGTRSEIAGDLIASAGTQAQKARWLPGIADGSILPAAVFTEPGSGSDLASLSTRATPRPGGGWRIHGAKSWITHAARSDLMTMLVRTGGPGHRGISMLLAEKPRGTRENPFPVPGLSGGEIPVLGYRGMREYELAFDGFEVASDGLLGDAEGQGFRQLMQTFEGARIQTAARAVGVARRAFELGLAYAQGRRQFGKPLSAFPRVADKLALTMVDIILSRELTLAAARAKDSGRRCDVEAGMAKLLAARTAWTAADACLQIHGGAGYALESEASRILCDARILSVFEGAAEIQAHVIARGLLAGAN